MKLLWAVLKVWPKALVVLKPCLPMTICSWGLENEFVTLVSLLADVLLTMMTLLGVGPCNVRIE